MKIYDFRSRDIAVLVRDKLTTRFTGHKFYVRTNGGGIDVEWQDGPSRQDVVLALDKYTNMKYGGFIKVFPDGSFHPVDNSFIRDLEVDEIVIGDADWHEDFIYARVYVGRVDGHREMTAKLVNRMILSFEKEFGITVTLGTLGRNKNYYIAYPTSFTIDGAVFERFGNHPREYSRIRNKWTAYTHAYSDYDERRSAENFLIPAASLADG